MKKAKLIYNPSSGKKVVSEYLDQITAIYQSYGYYITMYRLDFKDSEQDLIDCIQDTDDHHLLVAGGDGTINYIVNLLMSNNISTPIAILPIGTANDFATLLGVPNNIGKACHKILNGCIRSIDLGIANGKYFVNIFSCGLLTKVSQRTPTILKNTFGKLAYYMSGIGEIPHFRKLNIRIKSDGGNYDGSCLLFFVFNGQTAGKFKIAHSALVNDGLLDILIFKGDNPLETIHTIIHYIFTPAKRHIYPTGVIHIQCKSLHAECQEAEHTDIDGQAGPKFPLDINCAPSAIRILCPLEDKV